MKNSKMYKRVLCAAVAATMTLALCACGGGASKSSSGAIKIGGSGPLTGPAAVYGTAVKNAAEIAVEEVNAKGGLQFELRFEDDSHDAEKAVTAYGVLKDWGIALRMFERGDADIILANANRYRKILSP